MTVEPWIGIEELAVHVGVSKVTVYRWLKDKKIPAHNIGRLWKFKVSEVDAHIKKGCLKDSSPPKRKPLKKRRRVQ